jgi:acetyltransferase-like isoleucine patch superfamily enzyme
MRISAGTHNHTKWDFPLLRPRIAVGMDAGICTGVLVGPGVTVVKGQLLERGAVVLKDVKPWMIVIENTARD